MMLGLPTTALHVGGTARYTATAPRAVGGRHKSFVLRMTDECYLSVSSYSLLTVCRSHRISRLIDFDVRAGDMCASSDK